MRSRTRARPRKSKRPRDLNHRDINNQDMRCDAHCLGLFGETVAGENYLIDLRLISPLPPEGGTAFLLGQPSNEVSK